jgi:hypothetical protein
MAGKSGVLITKVGMESMANAMSLLTGVEVLVGFPEDTADRPQGDTQLTNATLGYIHDNGAPEQNIPARPFMGPGIESARDKLADKLGQTMRAVLYKGGDAGTVEQGLTHVGLIAKLAIQNAINEGPPPPLAKSTLLARARRGRKGAMQELDRRWDGQAPSVEFAKPLVDTGQMRNAVNYAIRSKKNRK